MMIQQNLIHNEVYDLLKEILKFRLENKKVRFGEFPSRKLVSFIDNAINDMNYLLSIKLIDISYDKLLEIDDYIASNLFENYNNIPSNLNVTLTFNQEGIKFRAYLINTESHKFNQQMVSPFFSTSTTLTWSEFLFNNNRVHYIKLIKEINTLNDTVV